MIVRMSGLTRKGGRVGRAESLADCSKIVMALETGVQTGRRERKRNENGDRGQGQAETGREQEVEVKVEGRMAGTWTARDDVNGESTKCGVRMRCVDAQDQ